MNNKNLDFNKTKTNNTLIELIPIILGIISMFNFFLTYIKYEFSGLIYKASAFDLLIAKGLLVENSIIKIPISIKLAIFIGILSCITAIIMLIYNKLTLAGILFVISSLCPIVVLLSGTKINYSLMNSGVNYINTKYTLPFFLTLIFNLTASIFSILLKGNEKLAECIFFSFSCISIMSVIIITVYMFISGIPAIYEIGLLKFLFGTNWEPSNNQYGILHLILSSIFSMIGAIIIGIPIGLLSAVYLSEIASKRIANLIRPLIQLLAGIPSVVYGFFGMLIIVPFIKYVFPNTLGDSLLAAIIILFIMVLPTIISTSEISLKSVPNTYKEASLALGATSIKTIFRITIPAAKSGIISGIILGVGRAIGETMAVIMVAGNVVNYPTLLKSVRFLTTGIVLEMSYSSGLHRQALFAIGLILFIFIIIVNISFTLISKKGVNINEK